MKAVKKSSVIFRFERRTSRQSAKSNRKTRCFHRSQSRINYVGIVCVTNNLKCHSLGSMNCLLGCSYNLQMHASCGRPTLSFVDCFNFGHSFPGNEAGFILFAVNRQEKIWAFKDVRECFGGTFD